MAPGANPGPGFSLPVGTVTLLLTDIAGSTRAWETAPEAMAAAVARHYEVLGDAIEAHNGVRPVEQGEGDSLVGAFARASDAIAAALDAQRAIQNEPWPDGAALRVRMAVHTGEAELRDEGNYFGPTMNRAARVRAIANGGQILLSGATADLVAERLPGGASLVDLGVHRLKDLGRPERVWALRHADLPTDLPAPKGLDALPNNLPVQLTSFVGRAREMDELREAVLATRLLTLTGVGGCGKTRIALQLAADVIDRHDGGAWLVELASLNDPDGIAAATALALGETDLAGDVIEVLVARIGDRSTLVVLDNCEHLLGPAASLADTLLRRCPRLTIVATSREPLGVPGETSWRVPSLALPASSAPGPIEALSQFDAVRLFLERAGRARPNFRLTAENAPAVAQICHRLDGIPLAIELAAARVRGVPVERIAAGLDDRFRLLTGGARTVLPRQQTLQASVDWGYDLLAEREQSAFRRLAVFAGSFTLDAAEQVVADDDFPAIDVFEVLLVLADKSMVAVDEDSGRYRMLETLRQYGTARLVDSSEVAEVRDRHLGWAMSMLDPTDVLRVLPPRFELVVADLRLAFEWALASSRADDACWLASMLARWEGNIGDAAQAVSVCERALGCAGGSHPAYLAVKASASMAYLEAGEFDRLLAVGEELVAEANELEDDTLAGRCLIMASYAAVAGPLVEDLPARARERFVAAGRTDLAWWPVAIMALRQARRGRCDEAESLAATIPEDAPEVALGNREIARAITARVRGDFERAWELTLETLTRPTQLRVHAVADSTCVMIDLAQGLDRGSHERFRQSMELATRRHNRSAALTTGYTLGAWELVRGDPRLALDELRAWQSATVRDTQLRWWGETIIVQALLANDLVDEAAAEIAEFLALTEDNPVERARLTQCAALVALRRGDHPTAERLLHEILGQQHALGWRPDLVGTLEALAGVAAAGESFAEAARLAGAASALRDDMGFALRWPIEQQLLDDALRAAREGLGAEAFDAATAEGRALDLDAAVAYATRARGERRRPTVGWESLTPTESEVVELVSGGKTNKEIAAALLMGSETVKTHLRHVFDKLGVRSRAALAAIAVERRRLLLDELDERPEDRLRVHERDHGAS